MYTCSVQFEKKHLLKQSGNIRSFNRKRKSHRTPCAALPTPDLKNILYDAVNALDSTIPDDTENVKTRSEISYLFIGEQCDNLTVKSELELEVEQPLKRTGPQ